MKHWTAAAAVAAVLALLCCCTGLPGAGASWAGQQPRRALHQGPTGPPGNGAAGGGGGATGGLPCPCDDVPPDAAFSCQQQAAWGKCGEPFMAPFCARSCNRCTCPGGGRSGTSTAAIPASLAAAAPGPEPAAGTTSQQQQLQPLFQELGSGGSAPAGPQPAAATTAASPPASSNGTSVPPSGPNAGVGGISAQQLAGQLSGITSSLAPSPPASSAPPPGSTPLTGETLFGLPPSEPASSPPSSSSPAPSPPPVSSPPSGRSPSPPASPGGTTGPDGCLTFKGLVATSPQFFSRVAQLTSQFGWDVPGCEDVVPGCRGGVTYFVPSDTAFDSLFAAFDAETAQALVSSKQALQALAAYHIVPSGVRTTQMSNGQQLPTLARDAQGNALSLTVRRGASAGSGGIVLQGMGSSARLLVPDVLICGGYAQVIDQVLLPVAVNATSSPAGPAASSPPLPTAG